MTHNYSKFILNKEDEARMIESGKPISECIQNEVIRIMKEIHRNREEILKAFIAKYDCQPDEVEQVIDTCSMGKEIWYVRKKQNVN